MKFLLELRINVFWGSREIRDSFFSISVLKPIAEIINSNRSLFTSSEWIIKEIIIKVRSDLQFWREFVENAIFKNSQNYWECEKKKEEKSVNNVAEISSSLEIRKHRIFSLITFNMIFLNFTILSTSFTNVALDDNTKWGKNNTTNFPHTFSHSVYSYLTKKKE